MNQSVSVIIPVRNGALYIDEAIKSVLAQAHSSLEILVIDDGSTDDTATVVQKLQGQSPQLHYIYQAPQGLSIGRNAGIQAAKGDYIAFLDADDRWCPNKLALQLPIIEQKKADMVFGQVVHFLSPELSPTEAQKLGYQAQVMPAYSAGAMLIKKSTFLEVGKFDPACRVGEFIDWYLRAMDLGLTSICLEDVVLERRVHNSNTSKKLSDFRQDYVRIVKTALDRRRK
jgi:glycosyltransferase involved in cell wall biosynthesis